MTSETFFSIIMPTYNRAFCICDAIDSLLAQTYHNFEFIIVDDCSTDGTKELVKSKYENEFKLGRFVYTKHKKNKGLNASRNTGLRLSKNEWIVFLDDDNKLFPNYLETYDSYIRAHLDIKIFYAMTKHLINNQVQLHGLQMDYAMLLNTNFIDMGVFVCKRIVYDEIGEFDERLRRGTDYDFILRSARLEKTFFIPEALLDYNDGDFKRITNSVSLEESIKIITEKMRQTFYPFYENVRTISSIYVFYDTGNGFSESTKEVFYHFPIEFNVTERMRSIMIWPCSRFCVVKNVSIKIDNREIQFTTNAYRQDGGTFYFDTDNPQIYITPDIQGKGIFYMDVFYLDAEVSKAVRMDWEMAIALQNSRSWKITKPLRWIGRIIRKIFRR